MFRAAASAVAFFASTFGRSRFRRRFRLIVLLLADFVFRDQLLVARQDRPAP